MSSAVQRAKRREEIDNAYGEVARAATWVSLSLYYLLGLNWVWVVVICDSEYLLRNFLPPPIEIHFLSSTL